MEDFNKALNYSFLLLKHRARTEKELTARLKRKGYSLPIVDKTIKFLLDYGYINDSDFISAFIREKVGKGYGRKKIYFDLKKLGADEESIKVKLADIDRDYYMEAMQRIIDKRIKSYSAKGESIKNRLFHYLIRRGFTLDEIREALDGNR